jgi:topoisomerase-4 subunit A
MPYLLYRLRDFCSAIRLCYEDNKPLFVGVSHMLKISTARTQDLLRQNLKYNWRIKKKMAFSTLEKIFIREEMYIDFKLYSIEESV